MKNDIRNNDVPFHEKWYEVTIKNVHEKLKVFKYNSKKVNSFLENGLKMNSF